MSTNRKSKSYSFELKLNAVNRVQAGESVKIVARQLEIVDPDYIYVWIKKYETYGEVGLQRKKRNSLMDDKEKIKELEMENEILKKYLQILKREEKKQSSK
ncbi:helix-turn-helix domain-containing protein [Bacillus sp. ISL-46]|uniref:helix-turn-helix domain-containing protein n=1 Tax=Bacillus sp. ISL-46 TaxID=2819129 RepID=UPI001BE560A4|nr:helix-turn-helix domain-containing protein [Bacillus sp. ISL-46]MBT2724287.1 transposase [Bacillus sp. ISL-46]